MATPKAVVILSGGVDSTVVLHHVAKALSHRPFALSFDYGQKHNKELACAKWQAQEVSAKHEIVNLGFLRDIAKMGGSALVAPAVAVPDIRDVKGDPQPVTYVPNRNMIMLSIAIGYAEAIGAEHVFYGAQKHDLYGYWDTTPQFLSNMNMVVSLNRKNQIRIMAPLVNMGKGAVVRHGLELGVNFGQTWSCYAGGEEACGRCPTCAERLKAFDDAGIPDPVQYVVGV